MALSARGVEDALFTPIAKRFVKWGISPDAVTIVGTLGVVVASLVLIPLGYFVVAALVITVFVLTDSIDGTMARLSDRCSKWGAFLDSTLDRVADAAIFSGLVIYYGIHDQRLAAGSALACLVLSMLVSYARARAEGLGMSAKVGFAERWVRIVVVLTAMFLVGFGLPTIVLSVMLIALALASTVTLIQRMMTVHAQSKNSPKEAE